MQSAHFSWKNPAMLALVVLALGATHCGSDDDDGANAGTGGRAGTGGAGAGGSSGDAIPDFNGCTASAYEDLSASGAERTIAIAQAGLVYSPKCLTVAVGQTVTWQGSLAAHPLAPGNANDAAAGSADNPIQATSTGQTVSFTFDAAGTYPYYCTFHSGGDGTGMAGVVHVK